MSIDTPQQSSKRIHARLPSLIHQKQGPLTRELLRTPGGFGLGQVPVDVKPDATTNMVCGYCSTGCSLQIHLQNGEAVNLTPATEAPVNLGMACPKGWEALRVLDSDERATYPLLRNAAGDLQPTEWHTALQTFTDRFQAIQKEHGPESVAFLSTGQIPIEEMALLGSLAKFGMGMIHGDGNTRQCMATAVTAYKESFGFDAPPYTYQDFEESDVLVFVGANLCIAHPIMWERVLRNPHSPEIVVIDPRRTETAMQATQHLAVAPKSDLTLFYGLAKLLIERNALDHQFVSAHTTQFEDFAKFVADFPLDRVVTETQVSEAEILKLAETIELGKRVSFWWTMGVNQSHQGTRTAQALINLALMTGNIGRPGTGANSITGQCNAMGSRLFSNTTNLLGGRDFLNPAHREELAGILKIDPDRIPNQNSWAYNEIIEGVLRGDIKGLWVIATNPAHSWINQNLLKDVFDRLEFLVVQDMYHTTETARLADLVLPAAGWGEKEGTFINSERRLNVIKKVKNAPGQALADFSIFKLIAHYWGCEEIFEEWTSPEAVFQILKQLSKDQPCDITGIEDYCMIDEQNGIQWPLPAGMKNEAQRRLFADGRFFHKDGKARFIFESPTPLTELPNVHYPFLLSTGRGSASQWHTQTRTRQSPVLRKLYPASLYVEINPQDAADLKVTMNDRLRITSQRGSITAKAFVTPTIKPGQLFLPMHDETTNQLTDAVFDPYSKQPAYKSCAVRITKE